MIKTLKTNKYFVIPLVIFLFVSILFLLFFDKKDTTLLLNSNVHPELDFLKWVTYLGNKLFLVILCLLVLLLISIKKGIILTIAGGVTTALAFFMKRGVSAIVDNYRPVKYFAEKGYSETLYLVEGVKLKEIHSFPSGHTSIVFCIFTMFAIYEKRNSVKSLFFLIALLVGYSRIYLYQHFLADVVAGAIIGFSCSIVTYGLLSNSKLLNKERLNVGMIKFIKK